MSTVDELHVMTFNLTYASVDGPHPWTRRRPVVAALPAAERPDLIDTQEGLAGQLDDIGADLGPGYGFVGTGRDGGRRGEFTAIFYRTDRIAGFADGPRIDWILVTPGVTVESAAVNLFRAGDRYPSDHLPVQVRLRLPPVKG